MTNYDIFYTTYGATLQQSNLYQPEPNPTFGNPIFADADQRILITRLSPFQDVERSTPHLFLAQATRRALPKAYIDMAFFPPQHDRKRMTESGIPLLIGGESHHTAQDFDIVLVSNAYTLELINLPYIFLNSGIPLLSSQRDESWPVFILGGSNAAATQAILTRDGDSMVDALFFGEGETQVEALLESLYAEPGISKGERLTHAAAVVKGLWVANQKQKYVEKAILPAPNKQHLLTHYPLLNGAETGTARIQINYGCPAFCTFCFEGYDRKPYREIALDDILEAARTLKTQGAFAIDLYSFNFNTYAQIFTLLLELNQLFEQVSFKSQRVDILYNTPGLLQAEVIADKRSYTLGIEGISHRMRAWMHKSLSDEAMMGVLNGLLHQKIREIKLFYILSGHEDEADLAEFHQFVATLKSLRNRVNRGIRIIFSFGALVRMPFTPLRYDALMLDEAEWRPLIGTVKSSCETQGFEFRMATPLEETFTTQVLALGGTWLHEPITKLAKEGYCYDTQLEPEYWKALRDWMGTHNQWTPEFLGEKEEEYAFPLSFVKSTIPDSFLYNQYRKAQEGIDDGYCLGNQDALGHCLGCGACTLPKQREDLLQHTIETPEPQYLTHLQNTVHTKRKLKPVYIRLWIPELAAGKDPAWINAWVLRSLLDWQSGWIDNLLTVQESLFTTKTNQRLYTGMYGETVFALKAWEITTILDAFTEQGENTLLSGKVRYMGMAQDFTPGEFKQADIKIVLPTSHFPEAGQHLRKYLHQQYVPVNIRRHDGGYQFDIPAKAHKKKSLLGGNYTQDAVQFTGDLVIGPKLDIVDFLRSFDKPEHYREARIIIEHLTWK
ncbi:MAG: radical SAM protein [Anaerolineae bacterium]|nr:radical SAM protein [Anaerolineae bacterium]